MWTTEYVLQLKRENGWYNSCSESYYTLEAAKNYMKDGLKWDPSREYRIIVRMIKIIIKEYIHVES